MCQTVGDQLPGNRWWLNQIVFSICCLDIFSYIHIYWTDTSVVSYLTWQKRKVSCFTKCQRVFQPANLRVICNDLALSYLHACPHLLSCDFTLHTSTVCTVNTHTEATSLHPSAPLLLSGSCSETALWGEPCNAASVWLTHTHVHTHRRV